MATLVLSTVGTMLGGPVGGAIGSLLGQSIDQQVLGPGPRHGPRLGDLSVQTSSYGTPVPRIFGMMRVAGSIVWSTDLKESSQAQGAKGQPETVTYSYSASFAVALSSRRITSVGRIWADGKLIRTAEGEFSVATRFRLYDGSETQPLDPLIASIEGANSTPAYRGLALAVFEDLELAEFGNRIPFLTFEVVADQEAVSIDSVLADVSEGAIESQGSPTVRGYAAYGATVAEAVEPLVNGFGISLFDDGTALSSPSAQVVAVSASETGCSGRTKGVPRSERSQLPAMGLPSALTLDYYDRDRDYQSGLARASIDSSAHQVERLELPAVLDGSTAKAVAETWLARRWAKRDKLILRLPPAYLAMRAGSIVRPPASSGAWIADRVTIDSLATILELRPAYGKIDAAPADPGRVLPAAVSIARATKIVVAELPDDGNGDGDSPIVVVAAAGSVPWRAVPLQVDVGGAAFAMRTAMAPAVIGSTETVLEPGEAALFDLRNSVDVQLANADDWLESRDHNALLAGANAAIIGREIIQFGDAIALGNGRFRLARLLRGRRGTEWAMGEHEAGESFLLLDAARLQRLPLTTAQTGAVVRVTPCGIADDGATAVEHSISGEAMSPPSPVHLRAAVDQSGEVNCNWVRRSSRGWEWIDAVDAPLGCSTERYRATLSGSEGEIVIETSTPDARFTPAQVAALGGGDLELRIVQVGDFGASRPATLSITIIS